MFPLSLNECASIYVRLSIKRNPITAVTTNTRSQRFFSSGSNLRFGGRQSTVTMGFHALAQSRLSPRFSSTRTNKSFLQYFATGSGTASCQDYEEYEFVECLSEETPIIDLFTNCKLQACKLSQCTLATRLKSCYNQLQKYLRHCTVFWHKWPIHDLVLVIPSPPVIKVASNTRPYSKL